MEREDHGQDFPQFKEVFGVAWPPSFMQWLSILESQSDGEFSQTEIVELAAGGVVPELGPLTSNRRADAALPVSIRLIDGGKRYCRKHRLLGYGENNTEPPAAVIESATAENAGEPSPSAAALVAEFYERASLSMSETGAEVFRIANATGKGFSADEKLRKICDVDAAYWAWRSPAWAKLLGVSDGAIRQTEFWKTERKKRFARSQEAWRDAHPERELPEELRSLGN